MYHTSTNGFHTHQFLTRTAWSVSPIYLRPSTLRQIESLWDWLQLAEKKNIDLDIVNLALTSPKKFNQVSKTKIKSLIDTQKQKITDKYAEKDELVREAI
jgi:hypothetical protein